MRFTTAPIPLYSARMKTSSKKWIPCIALLLLAGCFRNDIRTVVFEIKQLRSEESAMAVAQSLRTVSGIMEVRPDIEKHTLTVVFNGKEVYLKNLEYAIVKAGFDLPHWPADPADKAKLPEGIRQ